MSDVTTEIVYLPLKPGLELSAGETKEQWEDILGTIARQPGAMRVLWGRKVENQDTVQMVIDWDSLESHKAFMSSSSYPSFLAKMNRDFLAGEPTIFHVRFPAGHIAEGDPFTSPVTECTSGFFRADYVSKDFDTLFSGFRKQAAPGRIEEVNGIVGAWSLEEQGHEEEGGQGKFKVFVFFMGMDSVPEGASELYGFKRKEEEVPGSVKGEGRDFWHVRFQEYK